MNKRYLHHIWTRIRPFKVWYFLIAFLVCALVCALALRSNYATMTSLRSDVYTADESDKDVVGALNRLRSYVNSHMNTGLETNSGVYPPIQLKHTYERLQQAEKSRAERAQNSNSQVYTDAQSHCEALYPNSVSGGPRVPCIEQYVKDHGGASTTAKEIPDALYKFDFASPTWSPDLAGWSLVFAVLFLGLAALRFIAGRLLHSYTR
jgi:hypothetical protein